MRAPATLMGAASCIVATSVAAADLLIAVAF